MTDLCKGPAIRPDDEIATAFATAIGDYSRVLQGQTLAVAALCDQVTTGWLDGTADILAALDRLRAGLDDGAGTPEDLRLCMAEFADVAEARLTALMVEVQRQDMVRQMLDAVASMAGAIGDLDLVALCASVEAARQPRRIADEIEARFVMDEQRRAAGATAGCSAGSAPELF